MAIKSSTYKPDRLKLISGDLSIEDFKAKWADQLPNDLDYEILRKSPYSPVEVYSFSKLQGANQSIIQNKLLTKEVGADSEEFDSLFGIKNFGELQESEFEDDSGESKKMTSFVPKQEAFIAFAKSLLKFSDSRYNEKLETLKQEMLSEFENRFDMDGLKEELQANFETMLSEKSPTLMKQNSIETNFNGWMNRYINQTYYQNKAFRELMSNEISKDPKFLDKFLETSKDFLKLELKNNPNLELTPDLISSSLDSSIGNISTSFVTKQLIRKDLPTLDKDFDAGKYDDKTFELKTAQQPAQQPQQFGQQPQQFGQQFNQPYQQQPQPQQFIQQQPQIQQPASTQPEPYIAPNYQLDVAPSFLESLTSL